METALSGLTGAASFPTTPFSLPVSGAECPALALRPPSLSQNVKVVDEFSPAPSSMTSTPEGATPLRIKWETAPGEAVAPSWPLLPLALTMGLSTALAARSFPPREHCRGRWRGGEAAAKFWLIARPQQPRRYEAELGTREAMEYIALPPLQVVTVTPPRCPRAPLGRRNESLIFIFIKVRETKAGLRPEPGYLLSSSNRSAAATTAASS